MTEHRTAQLQFADRLRTALGKQSRRSGSLRRRVSSSPRGFADRLRSALR
jgi:hypothetical protein